MESNTVTNFFAATAAATIAGTTTLSAYLDAKFHFSSDLGQLYTFYLAAKTLAKAGMDSRLFPLVH